MSVCREVAPVLCSPGAVVSLLNFSRGCVELVPSCFGVFCGEEGSVYLYVVCALGFLCFMTKLFRL